MSRRSRESGAVRGPSSALTSFLANLGVEHALPTWPERTREDAVGVDPANAVTDENVEAGPSQAGEGTPVFDEDGDLPVGFKRGRGTDDGKDYNSKRARAASIDSDDLDNDDVPPVSRAERQPIRKPTSSNGNATPGPLKPVGDFMDCGECGNKFTVTAYTKEHPSVSQTYLCVQCCYKLGIDPFAKAKKAAPKKAPKKQDRAKVVHYEERKGVLALGDMCIKLIGKYIEDVEQLGDIGSINMDKVCRIICKSRRLAPETAPLFYAVDRTSLTMWDCTRLLPDSYIVMSNLCPNLEYIHLDLVGQMSTDSMIHWAKSLKKLKRLELHAPFLVRKEGWLALFEAVGKRFEGFLITQCPRIDQETVEAMVKHCPNMTELRLTEIRLNSDMIVALKPLKKLVHLDLSSPAESLSDDPVIEMIVHIGKNLETLILADNHDLTDAILPIIAKHCPKLRRLSLRNLTELTDEAVAQFFTTLKTNGHPGLTWIDMEKGHELGSDALSALLVHSGETVEWLSILGWREVTLEILNAIAACKKLKYLDVGWCRAVNNFWVKDILDGCPVIEELRVWGCNELSDGVPRKRGVKVVGIETHSI